MNMIRPIETEYNGYRFRSRLEARWAVFFDTLGIPYEYEPEGFELGDGIRYLPDFWLPEQRCWVEIKPSGSWKYHEECELLAEFSDCQYVLYVTGNPWPGDYRIAVYPFEGDPFSEETPWSFALGHRNDRRLWICNDDICAVPLGSTGPRSDDYPSTGAPRLTGAYGAARRARFEFGGRRSRYRRQPNG